MHVVSGMHVAVGTFVVHIYYTWIHVHRNIHNYIYKCMTENLFIYIHIYMYIYTHIYTVYTYTIRLTANCASQASYIRAPV